MAKLKAPLFSLGASGQLGKALVFFGWKGLDVVREYVVPANPQTNAQNTQRAYLTAVVAAIHAAQSLVTKPLDAVDITAYSLWASVVQSATTWFNQVCRSWIKQRVAGLRGAIYRDCSASIGNTTSTFSINWTKDGANNITAGLVHYGTSKTALVNTVIMDNFTASSAAKAVAGLTNGVKYFFQFRPSAHADFVGARTGIYHATPSA